ncbi:unnamed protein product [Miscanthus lutarioriparius]|uniref:Uncharacterized protein n=1 Tax=Miscanthus lutarioriparius TaxID=422564 RepID=A0A811RDD9_9POAL|nr:unnamed protein product [Miscanthus lutarioriparius]
MADEPSDACSRTDEDGVRGSWNNKRKSTHACSYPNKKHGFVIRNEWECYVICVFAAVVLILIYLFTEGEDEEDHEEDREEEGEVSEEDRDVEEEAKEEEEGEEEEDEEEGDDEDNEDEDEEARANLLKVVVDCFIATKGTQTSKKSLVCFDLYQDMMKQ